MADKTVRGRFVWHELMTSDSVAAYGFYAKALGWKTVPHEGDVAQTSFAGPGGPLAGASQQDEGTPSWIPFVGSTDLEKTIEDATAQGASVTKSITAIGGGGRYAMLADPQGAAFGVYAPGNEPPREAPAKRGEYSWHELATTDADAALDFYAALFGWEKMAEHDMGPGGMYLIFGRNGKQLGGIYKSMPGQSEPAWLGYVRVKNVEQAVKKVKAGGGQLVNGPMDVPGGDRVAQFMDPQGAAFAVHALAADLQPAAPKAEAAPAAVSASADEETASAPAAPAKKPRKSAPRKPVPAAEEPAEAVAEEEPVRKARTPRKAATRKSPARKPAAKQRVAKKAPTKVAAKAKRPATKSGKRKAARKVARPSARKAANRKAVKKTGGKTAQRPAKKATKKSRGARKAK